MNTTKRKSLRKSNKTLRKSNNLNKSRKLTKKKKISVYNRNELYNEFKLNLKELGYTKIGIALSIPSLDEITRSYREKYDKYSHLEPHMTVYLSDYNGHKDIYNLVKIIKNHGKKVILDKIVHNNRLTYLNVKNFKYFWDINKEATRVFGNEKFKNRTHITLGYKVPDEEYYDMKKNIKVPIITKGTKFKIVLMKDNGEAKELYI